MLQTSNCKTNPSVTQDSKQWTRLGLTLLMNVTFYSKIESYGVSKERNPFKLLIVFAAPYAPLNSEVLPSFLLCIKKKVSLFLDFFFHNLYTFASTNNRHSLQTQRIWNSLWFWCQNIFVELFYTAFIPTENDNLKSDKNWLQA